MDKFGLLGKLVLAIIGGVLVGLLDIEFLVRVLATFNGLFGNFLSYIVPLIVIAFIVPGIAELGGKAGKLLGITVGIAYLSTLIAGIWAWIGTSTLIPFIVGEVGEAAVGRTVEPLFTIAVAPIMGVMTALVSSFILGLGIASIKGTTLLGAMQEFQQIIKKVIDRVFLPLLPFHIAGIFAQKAYSGEIMETLGVYGAVFLLTISLDYVYILFQYALAGGIAKTNPFKAMKKLLPAYMTAIGTQSSAATIPVTTKCLKKIDGVTEEVAEFVGPLGASTHLAGSTITLISCAIAVLALDGISLSLEQTVVFIMTLGVTMVAAPGVPGGAIVASLGLLETMLGFNEAQMAVMVAIYIAQDGFGTAANVMGDGAIALIVNKLAKTNAQLGKLKSKKGIA